MATPEQAKGTDAVHYEVKDGDDSPHNVQLKSSLDSLGIWATVKRFKKAVLVCNLISIAAAADGYQYTMNGNIIANSGFIRHMGFYSASTGKYALNANYTALWGAMQSLGQLVGMVLLNPVSDRIGRKTTLYVLWLILAGSIAIETQVRQWRDWAGAKFLVGIGVGALQSTLPIYVTEWSPANIRGSMVLAYGFWNTIGKFLAPLVLLLVEDARPQNYLDPIYTQWGFLGIMLPIFLWLPETPAYFASRDQDERGKAALRRVNGTIAGYDVEREYAIIRNTVLRERAEMAARGLGGDGAGGAGSVAQNWRQVLASYLECFRGTNFKRTLGATLPACTQQLTGLAFLNVYSSLFFKQSGFTDAFLITTIMTAIALVTAVSLILTTDRFGRRNIVIISACVCTAAMLVVAGLGYAPKTKPLKNVLIFFACVWSFFSTALGTLGWAFVGEVSSQKLRARTAGLAAAGSVIFGLTFNTAVPVIIDPDRGNWGYKTGFLFFGTGLACCILTFLYVPEPSQRNAAELDELYEKGVPAWRMRKHVTDVQIDQQQLVSGKEAKEV